MTNILITGYPGIGKTTLLLKLAERLKEYRIAGFVTREIRESSQRVGFEIETFDGRRGVLAHLRFRTPHRVGKYRVDIPNFERLIEPVLTPSHASAGIFLIDEIGKMECFSTLFTTRIGELLDSPKPVVATIARKGPPFITGIKSRRDAALFEITLANRDSLLDVIEAEMATLLG